jgi:hypothetical protein
MADSTAASNHGSYRPGKRYVVQGVLTAHRRPTRAWKRHEAYECQRVEREPLRTVVRRVA